MSSHSEAVRIGFTDEAFPLEDYPDFRDGTFCNLSNENLFTKELFLFKTGKASPFSVLLPAFSLASRLILEKPEAYAVFINRDPPEDENGFCNLPPDYDDQRSREELITIIRRHLPLIDLDPDISAKGEEYGYTILLPKEPRDTIAIDYELLRLIRLPTTRISDSQRVSALFGIATLICHEMAHVLEFRTTRHRTLRPDGEPFTTPLGSTGAEAGHAWELHVFGGKLDYCCERACDLMTLRGLVVQSGWWNLHYRSMEPSWIKKTFREEFWGVVPRHLVCFTEGTLARKNAWNEEAWQGINSGNEDDDNDDIMDTPTKKRKRTEGDVVVNSLPTGLPTRPHRTCGPRRVVLN